MIKPEDLFDTSLDENDPWLLAQALHAGANPNPKGTGFSPLHDIVSYRNELKNRLKEGKETITLIRDTITLFTPKKAFAILTPKISSTREEIKKAELSSFVLIAYGARLDHMPAGSKSNIAPLIDDIGCWQDKDFGGQLMINALYVALKKDRPLPRFDGCAIIDTAKSLVENEADERVACDNALLTMENIRGAVTRRLLRPITPVEAFVAHNIPPKERQYWHPTFKGWTQAMRQRATHPTPL